MSATHQAVVDFGPIAIPCAILEDERRGFLLKQMTSAIGFVEKTRSGRFAAFLHKIGVNELNYNGKSEWPFIEVTLPRGGTAFWVEWDFLPAVIKAVNRAKRADRLSKHHDHIAERCLELSEALLGVAIVALIDDVTGFQYRREPNVLQDLLQRLLRDAPTDWKLRFEPSYYKAICKLFGFEYAGHHRPLPPIVGYITDRWVYGAIFPREIIDEIKARRDGRSLHDKLHQWLAEGPGLAALDAQIKEVTTIAATSTSYRDFEGRCAHLWCQSALQMPMIFSFKPAA